jgi:hypothetical protein
MITADRHLILSWKENLLRSYFFRLGWRMHLREIGSYSFLLRLPDLWIHFWPILCDQILCMLSSVMWVWHAQISLYAASCSQGNISHLICFRFHVCKLLLCHFVLLFVWMTRAMNFKMRVMAPSHLYPVRTRGHAFLIAPIMFSAPAMTSLCEANK